MTRSPLATAALTGVALAAAFFYPLAAALESQGLYMQWTVRDERQLAAAIVLGALVLGAASYGASRLANPRWRIVVFCLLAVIPLASFSSALVRALPAVERALTGGMAPWAAALIGAVVAAILAMRFPTTVARLLQNTLVVLSPLSVVVAVAVAQVETIEVAFSRGVGRVSQPSSRVVVLVFDELSKRQLFDGRQIRAQYAGFAAIAARARVYHAARSGGSDTLVSMLSLLDLRDYRTAEITRDGIVATESDHPSRSEDDDDADLLQLARSRGFSTGVIGWMLPYCHLARGIADRCLSLSPYNAGSVSSGFSLWAPVKSTLLLWPYQKPTGFIKVPLFLDHRRKMIERADAMLDDMVLDAGGPTFVLAHLALPHGPFMYDASGFHPPDDPFAQTLEHYVAQLTYLDAHVSRLIDRWTAAGVFANTTLVVTSDHDFREVMQGEARVDVPLLVVKPSQTHREEASTPVLTFDVVRAVLEGSS